MFNFKSNIVDAINSNLFELSHAREFLPFTAYPRVMKISRNNASKRNISLIFRFILRFQIP